MRDVLRETGAVSEWQQEPKMDLTGIRFRTWEVIGPAYRDTEKGWYWKVRCRCPNGTVMTVRGDTLAMDLPSHCGCGMKSRPYEAKEDLTGQKFGRLEVLGPAFSTKAGWFWLCRCSCEKKTEKVVRGLSLRQGTQSCGCLQQEVTSARATSHGMTGTPEYQSWQSMKDRCLNANHKQYHDYGGRGITIDMRWLGEDGFINFYADMGPIPNPGMTLDRYPDKNGPYTKSNCRWATRREQQLNRRNNILYEYDGRTMPLDEWAEYLSVNRGTLAYRLRSGMSFVEAVEKSVRMHKKPVPPYKGQQRSLKDLEEVAGVKRETIRFRLDSGWTIEAAVETPPGAEDGGMPWKKWTQTVFEIGGVTKTLKEWAEGREASLNTITQRLRMGWDIKRALTTPAQKKS